jgi:transposase
MSMRKVASIFDIGTSTVSRWARNGIAIQKRVYVPTKMMVDVVGAIKGLLSHDPCMDLRLLCTRIFATFGVRISKSLASTAIRRAGFSRKKARIQFTPKSADELSEARTSFCKHVFSYRGRRVIFVDESGFSMRNSPTMLGYAPKGTPVRIFTRPPRGRSISLIAAISNFGFWSCFTRTGSVDSATFASFLSTAGIPSGGVIVMDNAAIHRTRHVHETIAALGCEPLFIPPYSPDFNAIENIFGIMKRSMRRQGVPMTETAVRSSFAGVDPDVVSRTSLHRIRTYWKVDVAPG